MDDVGYGIGNKTMADWITAAMDEVGIPLWAVPAYEGAILGEIKAGGRWMSSQVIPPKVAIQINRYYKGDDGEFYTDVIAYKILIGWLSRRTSSASTTPQCWIQDLIDSVPSPLVPDLTATNVGTWITGVQNSELFFGQ